MTLSNGETARFNDGGFLDEVGPYTIDGREVRAFVRSGNVSSSGPAIVSNARWVIVVDGVQRLGFLGEPDDTEEKVRAAIEEFLRHRD